MNAKAFLSEIKKIERLMENKKAEKAQWMDLALNITGRYDGERVKSTSDPHKLENAVIRSVDIEREIEECIVKLYRRKAEIIAVIEKLPVHEYDVLHKIYVQGFSLQEVADMKGRTYSMITTMHGMALKKVQKIIDAEEEKE